MIIANVQKDLTSSVVFASTGLPKYYGTVYAIIWLEHPNDGYDGRFWDGSAWATGVQTFPTSTHIKSGVWRYPLPATATDGYSGSYIHWMMADSSSEADITSLSKTNSYHIRSGQPVTASSVEYAVWDAYQDNHTLTGTYGLLESNIRGPDSDDLKDVTDKIEAIPSPTEMSFATWNINENIPITVFVADPITGNGLTGQSSYITLTIQRATDRKYWNGSTWQVASYDLTMAEVDASAEPGVYKYTLSGSTGNTQQDSYTAYATVDNPGTVTGQNIEIHISRDSSVKVYESEPSIR